MQKFINKKVFVLLLNNAIERPAFGPKIEWPALGWKVVKTDFNLPKLLKDGKIAEALLIKSPKPCINVQEASVSLKLF